MTKHAELVHTDSEGASDSSCKWQCSSSRVM
jgi:hypothetical protein